MPVILGQAEYPFQLEKTLSEAVSRCVVIEAAKEAEEIGDPRVMNMVLLGAVVKKLGLDEMSGRNTQDMCAAGGISAQSACFRKGNEAGGAGYRHLTQGNEYKGGGVFPPFFNGEKYTV